MTNERKSRITISIEPSLIEYAEHIGRSNASLGFRHALIEYRDKLDTEKSGKTKPVSYSGEDSEGTNS